LAIEPELVEKEMKSFFEEILEILKQDLSNEEIFFYASLIHLRFVHIHPFSD
jgi:Fic family protein